MHGVSSITLLEGGWGCCTRSDRLWTFSRDTGGTLWSIASFFTNTYKYLHTRSHVHSTRSRLDWSIGAFLWVLLCYKCQARPANDHERPEFGPRARGGGIFNCRGVLEPHLRAKYLHPPLHRGRRVCGVRFAVLVVRFHCWHAIMFPNLNVLSTPFGMCVSCAAAYINVPLSFYWPSLGD